MATGIVPSREIPCNGFGVFEGYTPTEVRFLWQGRRWATRSTERKGMEMRTFTFGTQYVPETKAVLKWGKYADGSTALRVVSEYGEPLATATVCLRNYNLQPGKGNVFIYGDYSEHVGVFEALRKAGIVGDPVNRIPMGGFGAFAYEAPLLWSEHEPTCEGMADVDYHTQVDAMLERVAQQDNKSQ
ncbi:hypothetical protein SEND513_59 [Mycobacterium phage Send513]|uniref:Uncharacterized protein n=7 Tax=Papyrusvirus TaxID=1982554 RepID=A0A0Y0ADZ1_9CAUD|nr:hypothetical protein N842_gp059 [Mycobacterium phage Papyrus]YP_009614284.1 hypothetical protein FDI62_gp59 [Mycobacterium phage Send513]AMB17272.1 hypothetical protein SEA_WEISS13_58 [Mycobacterium phage Weiss13]ARW57144.1 hypothetical protein SEA_ZENON_59 [Mycobacterium phage Zenon]AVO21457.1 hypothetical protein PBI_NILO_60 [Mycobacterium phage Nilo]AYQ98632.1 hypothetical protein SEA_RIPARIAN_60 [Mycobacterium phage Riparian]QCG78164.1 hypothetical protein SEA_CANDLE_57 [Mycobacterium 